MLQICQEGNEILTNETNKKAGPLLTLPEDLIFVF
jgi:hypothetical protein